MLSHLSHLVIDVGCAHRDKAKAHARSPERLSSWKRLTVQTGYLALLLLRHKGGRPTGDITLEIGVETSPWLRLPDWHNRTNLFNLISTWS